MQLWIQMKSQNTYKETKMTNEQLKSVLEDTTRSTEDNIKNIENALNKGSISKKVLFGMLKLIKTQTKLIKKLILLCFK